VSVYANNHTQKHIYVSIHTYIDIQI
jgi:hypothetical protein